jgi:hypothetical protein
VGGGTRGSLRQPHSSPCLRCFGRKIILDSERLPLLLSISTMIAEHLTTFTANSYKRIHSLTRALTTHAYMHSPPRRAEKCRAQHLPRNTTSTASWSSNTMSSSNKSTKVSMNHTIHLPPLARVHRWPWGGMSRWPWGSGTTHAIAGHPARIRCEATMTPHRICAVQGKIRLSLCSCASLALPCGATVPRKDVVRGFSFRRAARGGGRRWWRRWRTGPIPVARPTRVEPEPAPGGGRGGGGGGGSGGDAGQRRRRRWRRRQQRSGAS